MSRGGAAALKQASPSAESEIACRSYKSFPIGVCQIRKIAVFRVSKPFSLFQVHELYTIFRGKRVMRTEHPICGAFP